MPEPRPATVEVLGVRFHNLTRREAALAIARMVQEGQQGYVVKPYVEFLPPAARDPQIRRLLNGAHLCLADGVAVLWAARYLSLPGGLLSQLWQFPLSLAAIALCPAFIRRPLRENMAGVDLAREMLAQLDHLGARIFLLGGREEEVRGTRAWIEGRFHRLRVVGDHHGYFDPAGPENEEVVRMINESGAQVLLVAMGFPRQERWMAENLPRLRVNVAVGEGGTFTFLSGAAARAPRWMRARGLEWLYRLLREPRRLRRQRAILDFLWLVFRERMRQG